eukprot:gb/GECH01006115.1/.p1 GENE.gb/GECH01006115.1/~~gb/GECH01006115.1/.p1  ORF type:complete len:105 (+),score=25.23 gb/GECH01006115.1/:1-315(+)
MKHSNIQTIQSISFDPSITSPLSYSSSEGSRNSNSSSNDVSNSGSESQRTGALVGNGETSDSDDNSDIVGTLRHDSNEATNTVAIIGGAIAFIFFLALANVSFA